MSRRVRFCLALYMFVQNRILGNLISWIAGKSGIDAVMRGLLELQRGAIQELPDKMAKRGLAREGSEMIANLDQLTAELRPNSEWVWHKATWGDCEVVVVPRVVDSNTGVVVGPPDHRLRGRVITCDHLPPNCDPPALQKILEAPGLETV